jgi:protocatechuate 3,4-dioxygenase, beta subunit
MSFYLPKDRRSLLRSFLLTAGGVFTAEVYAEALALTPRMTEGPYYPDHLPLDQDNDLVSIADGNTAAGIITEFGGRVLNVDGKPMANHQVELWQADDNGCYIHSKGTQKKKERDPAFQGYGKIQTNARGEYRFRTIKPGLYTGRTLHWHIAVNQGGKRLLTTQLFMAGVQQNERDGLLKGIRDDAQRLSIIREFKAKESGSKELQGTWDIVLGATPDERQMGRSPQRRESDRRPALTERDVKDALFGPSPF